MSERKNQALHPVLDAVDAGIIVLDRDARVARWNSWIASASGLSSDAAMGRTLPELFPGLDLRRMNSAIAGALESGLSSLLSHAIHSNLLPLRTRAGRTLLYDITISAIRVQPALCLLQITDVTMAVRREQFLRQRQNARYDAVVENAPDAILTLDGGQTIRFANPTAVAKFGHPLPDLLEKNVSILFDPGGGWSDIWQAAIDGQPRGPIELVARLKDGSPSYFEASASRWHNDTRVFVTAILRDVNERRLADDALRASEAKSREIAAALADLNATLEQRVKERTDQLMAAEEELRQSHKMEAIGQLTGGIAHDFNNLLQGIVGALDMVQKRIAEGRILEIDRFLQGARSSTQRAAALTHRLLAFARRQPVDPRPVDINLLVRAMEELLRRSTGERITMKIVGAIELALVRCDANQLENALLNLAINARDAMPDGGTLTITTSNRHVDARQAIAREVAAGDYVCLAVRDDGTGMPPDVQARVFEPFYTTKPIGQGTGLGLSMVYGFVRQSGGFVRIESQPGQGTTIEINLPRFDGMLEAANSVAADDEELRGNSEIVLVAEDDSIVRLLVVEVLRDLGYRVLEAWDGPGAARILQSSQRIDLLVTDIGLPEINGRQVADEARTRRPNLKILFMTGYAESAASSAFLEGGMQIISKPFTVDRLMKKIHEMMRNSPA